MVERILGSGGFSASGTQLCELTVPYGPKCQLGTQMAITIPKAWSVAAHGLGQAAITAVSNGWSEILDLILQADPESCNFQGSREIGCADKGKTPLWMACAGRQS